MMTKSKKEPAHKFQSTCCGSFQIHLPVIVYHSANTDHNSYLGLYSKIFPDPFCLFVVRICDAYYCQIVVEFFLDWQWHFIESLPTIHVLRWKRTFYKHPANVFNVFIGKRFQIFLLSLHHIFSHNFFYTFEYQESSLTATYSGQDLISLHLLLWSPLARSSARLECELAINFMLPINFILYVTASPFSFPFLSNTKNVIYFCVFSQTLKLSMDLFYLHS